MRIKWFRESHQLDKKRCHVSTLDVARRRSIQLHCVSTRRGRSADLDNDRPTNTDEEDHGGVDEARNGCGNIFETVHAVLHWFRQAPAAQRRFHTRRWSTDTARATSRRANPPRPG